MHTNANRGKKKKTQKKTGKTKQENKLVFMEFGDKFLLTSVSFSCGTITPIETARSCTALTT